MVKVLKHELYALFRVLIFFAIGVLVFAVIGRLSLLPPAENETADALATLFSLFHLLAIYSFVIVAFALGVSRFYKTLFTGEGYMTLSLPVSSDKLIWGKLLAALIGMFFAVAVSVLSALIYVIGDRVTLQSLFSTLGLGFTFLWEEIAADPLIAVELVIFLVVTLPAPLLSSYALLSVGQLFTAHRKGLTFLLFVAFVILSSVFSDVCMMPILEAADGVSPHLSVWVYLLIILAVDVGSFFLTRFILRNKVNLIV